MAETPPPRPSFLEELKRRKVVRVAIVYGAVAWAVIQIGDVAFPTFGAPDWVMRVLMLLLALGAPVALVLAWAFEVTPEGVRRTEGLGAAEGGGGPGETGAATAPGHATGWLNVRTVAAVVGLVALGWLAGSWASGGGAGSEPATAGNADGLDPLKVAVLPFRNAARDDESALVVAGLHDDILTRLSRIGALRIVSRTSVMYSDSRSEASTFPQMKSRPRRTLSA